MAADLFVDINLKPLSQQRKEEKKAAEITVDIEAFLNEGLGTNPFQKQTANEWFMTRMTEGKTSHLSAMRWNCIRNLQFRYDLKKIDNLTVCKSTLVNGVPTVREVSDKEYMAAVVRDHIAASHHASMLFAEHDNRGKFDLKAAIQTIIDHPSMADCAEVAKKRSAQGI